MISVDFHSHPFYLMVRTAYRSVHDGAMPNNGLKAKFVNEIFEMCLLEVFARTVSINALICRSMLNFFPVSAP